MAVSRPPRVRTAFERTLLPEFAEWFVRRVELERPDFLVPAETKGARLLDIVLDYAGNELGAAIDVPVIYRPALAYMDRELLTNSKVLVLDDAKRTGNSVKRHCRRLAEFGVTDIAIAICFKYDEAGEADESETREAFLQVGSIERYLDYACQMTELVIASGLPPEVDHHLFDLEVSGRLRSVWGELERALAPYGELNVDAPREKWGELCPMTLHFPQLPGTTALPGAGMARADGPYKVRLFPDVARNRVVVVPVSFPTLDLPVERRVSLTVEEAKACAREWSGADDSFAEALLDRAVCRDPETVFRALSAFGELDLACGLARALGGSDVGVVGLHPQRLTIERLYGHDVAPAVVDRIEASLDRTVSEPCPRRREAEGVPLFVDEEVVDTTEEVATHLRKLYKDRTERLGHEPPERVGRPLAALASDLEVKALLASRCIDFGLALTTIVPYVDVERRGDGVRVSRKYRVSEQGPSGRSDRQVDNQLIAEEILAYASMHLAARSERLGGGYLPVRVATRVMAALRAWLRSENVHLEIRSDKDGMRAEVWRGVERRLLPTVDSRMFEIRPGGDEELVIVPTEKHFLELKEARNLRLDNRGLVIQLEGFLEALGPLFSPKLADEDFERLLSAAAMSADQALGLTHVQQLLELGLDRLEAQLNKIVRGGAHPVDEELGDDVEKLVDKAGECVKTLESDWAAQMADLWEDPSRTEELLLESIVLPRSKLRHAYDVPSAVLYAVDAASALTTALDRASAAHWDGEDCGDLVKQVFDGGAELRRALSSLRDSAPGPDCPGATRDGIAAAATILLDGVAVIRSFAAATARDDRGPRRGEPLPVPVEEDRYHTVLFPDLAKSREYARAHPFEANYEWKNTGLGIVAQWARAFGGVETRPRQGDAQWMEFQERGDPAILAGAAAWAHTTALAAANLPYLTWSLHLGIHIGRIKEAEIDNAIALTLDEMNELCKAGRNSDRGTDLNVTAEVLDSCSPQLSDKALTTSLADVAKGEGLDLSGGAADVYAIDPNLALAEFVRNLEAVATSVKARIGDRRASAESFARRDEAPDAESDQASASEQA